MQDAGFVRQAFANIADRYVLANHVLSAGTDILWRRTCARHVARLAPQTILDLATGSGDLAVALRDRCPSARILGADFSVPMMRQAQKRPFEPLIAADGLALPLADAAFDAVTVAFGLRNMASWPRALQEMSRVLKPGGWLYVLDFSIPPVPPLDRLYLWYLKRVLPRVAGWITGDRASYEYLASSIEKFPSGSAMECLICDHGFARCESRRLSFGIASLYSAQKAP